MFLNSSPVPLAVESCLIEFRPEQRWFEGVHERIAADDAVGHEFIHNVSLLTDDSAVVLFELVGDVERIESLLESNFVAHAYYTEAIGRSLYVFAHFEPNETIEQLLRHIHRYAVLLDLPMEYTGQGTLQIRLVGDKATITDAVDAISNRHGVSVHRTGAYRPRQRALFSLLTPKQQAALTEAIDSGYYNDPRNATYEDLAERLDCSVATIGEHLRKAEARILSRVVQEAQSGRPPGT